MSLLLLFRPYRWATGVVRYGGGGGLSGGRYRDGLKLKRRLEQFLHPEMKPPTLVTRVVATKPTITISEYDEDEDLVVLWFL